MRILAFLFSLSISGLTMADEYVPVDSKLQKRTDAVLAIMGYAVVPDLTTSTLSISNTETGNPDLVMSQLAGGFTISQTSPLYLEGGISYSRYDPVLLFSDGTDTQEVPLKWTSVMLTGGVGWNFPLTDYLKIRPVANVAYGHMESDISPPFRILQYDASAEVDFLDSGSLDALGYGGSLMLDYEDYKPAREIDIEWRYSHVVLENIGSSSNFAQSDSSAVSTSLWARWRAPTGLAVMHRPLRYVLELAHSTFFGDQEETIGFDELTSVGVGMEIDSSHYDIIVTRTRLVARYRFGENMEGVALGLAISI